MKLVSRSKTINHKGHKVLKGREARKIKLLRPLRSLQLILRIRLFYFVTLVLFVVKSPLPIGCDYADAKLWVTVIRSAR
jgi:hypothetical protein